jgi:hypothetical protein
VHKDFPDARKFPNICMSKPIMARLGTTGHADNTVYANPSA